jgi:hypothetical protein
MPGAGRPTHPTLVTVTADLTSAAVVGEPLRMKARVYPAITGITANYQWHFQAAGGERRVLHRENKPELLIPEAALGNSGTYFVEVNIPDLPYCKFSPGLQVQVIDSDEVSRIGQAAVEDERDPEFERVLNAHTSVGAGDGPEYLPAASAGGDEAAES